MPNQITRKRFLGYSAMMMASAVGATTFSLTSCKKDNDDGGYFESIVIGSGFGGSVCALRLSQAKRKTLLLEMGKSWYNGSKDIFSPNFPPDNRSTWLTNITELPFGPNLKIGSKYVGVMNRVVYPHMRVYRNICLGGGSISNGGVLLMPKEEHFNSFLFNDIDYAEVNGYANQVKTMMQASIMPVDLFNSNFYKYAQITQSHALNAGLEIEHAYSFYNFDTWRKELNGEIKRSALKGELLYGNNNGIKNSLEKNYLAEALATAYLSIKTLRKVVEVRQKPDETFEVMVNQIDEQGNVVRTESYASKHLFICAGSVGTSEILVKARDTGALENLDDAIGNGWGPNGNAFAFRSGLNESTGNIHSSPPTLTVKHLDNPISPVNAMQDIFPIGIDLKMLLMVGQPYIETRGKFIYNASAGVATLEWPKNGNEQGAASMGLMIDRLNEANGGKLDTDFIKEGVSQNFTYHPLGGAVLGKASDLYGRLKGYKNLYAIDGSMLPGNCGLVNPSLMIAALAERNIKEIIEKDFCKCV